MSDYEADDERFGTRTQRFLEDQREGQLAEEWDKGDGAGKTGKCAAAGMKNARTRTSCLIKTASDGSDTMSSQKTVRDIIDIDFEKSCRSKLHGSTAINLEFNDAPVIVGLPLKDGAWKEQDRGYERMQNVSKEDASVRGIAAIASSKPGMAAATKAVHHMGEEVANDNDNARSRARQTQETHRPTNFAVTSDLRKQAVFHNHGAIIRPQRSGGECVSMTSAIPCGASAHASMMKPPAVPSKAFEKSATSTFSQAKSAQELVMKGSAVPLKAQGGSSSTRTFSRTKSAHELTMTAAVAPSNAQSSTKTATSVFSRTISAQELFMQPAKTTSPIRGNGKEKAVSVPVPSLPTLDAARTSASTAQTANSPPRLRKPIPPAIQLLHENFANFEMAIAAQSGTKVKYKKGKGMYSMEKADLKSQSELFKGCVVVVAHHLSAKAEQLVPRWSQVSA